MDDTKRVLTKSLEHLLTLSRLAASALIDHRKLESPDAAAGGSADAFVVAKRTWNP
jgi:hypothetical protein